jgi:hypothetical protein
MLILIAEFMRTQERKYKNKMIVMIVCTGFIGWFFKLEIFYEKNLKDISLLYRN